MHITLGGRGSQPQSQTCRTRWSPLRDSQARALSPKASLHSWPWVWAWRWLLLPLATGLHVDFQLQVVSQEPSLQVHSCVTWKTLTLPGAHKHTFILCSLRWNTWGSRFAQQPFSGPTDGLCPKLGLWEACGLQSVCYVCKSILHTYKGQVFWSSALWLWIGWDTIIVQNFGLKKN